MNNISKSRICEGSSPSLSFFTNCEIKMIPCEFKAEYILKDKHLCKICLNHDKRWRGDKYNALLINSNI